MKLSTVKSRIHADVATVSPFDETEEAHIADTLAWIASGANIFRIAKPDKPPKHLVAYFVLIDPTHRSMLLGDHIKAQLWLPNGGHVLFNEYPLDTVRRESMEELNQPATFLRSNELPFFVTTTQTVGLTPGHTDVSLWYLLQGNIHHTPAFSRDEFTDMQWFTFDEILESHPAIFDPHLQRFTRKLIECA